MQRAWIISISVLAVLILFIGMGAGTCGGNGDESGAPPPEDEEEAAVTPTPAEFEVISLNIDPSEVTAGETATVTAVVENTGGSEGTYTAALTVDGVTIETKEMTIIPGSSEVVTFSLAEDIPGTYEICIGELSSSLVVMDTWTLSSPLYFLGTFTSYTMQALTSYQGGILGGSIDYVYQKISDYWDSIQASNTFILFNASLEDSLQDLGEWPEQYKEACPFSIYELEVNNPPFALLKRQDNGLIRAIILVDNEPDIVTFITFIENTQVPVGVPWTLTNGEVTIIEVD